MASTRFSVAVAVGGALAATVGCRPSPRIVHQGNAYFEHCYAADRDPTVNDVDREACWSAWLAHYTRHQPPHRIDFAMRRVEALQMGDFGDPTPESGGDRTPAHDPVQATNAMERFAPAETDPPHGCGITCQQLRAECQLGCEGRGEPCVQTCEASERVCRGGCY